MVSHQKIVKSLCAASFILLGLCGSLQAQQLTATAQSKIQITKGAKPTAITQKLREDLQIRAVKNVLEATFSIKMTPQVEAKLPELVELLIDSIQVEIDPADGDFLSGRARLTVASARLNEYLKNKGIGAGDIATQSAKILVSIDEFIGVATNLDSVTATQTKTTYSHDKSTFSDTSSKASESQSQSDSNYSKSDVAYASKDSAAVASKSSSAFAGSQKTAVAGSSSSAAASQGYNGSAAAASQRQYAGASSTQVAGAQSSQFAAASSSQKAFADKSVSASSSASASASSSEQNNIQQRTDKVNLTVETKMPEFNNAQQLGGGDRVLTSRLSGEFKKNGLELVAEQDLRSEGGRTLPYWEINNNGRVNDFLRKIVEKDLKADVWATGTAKYTIVGTTPTGTQCNGTLDVQGRFIDGNRIFFEDSMRASAVGNGDQDCRAALAISLATSLAKVLGETANKELNAKNSRGSVYTLYVYSKNDLGRQDRQKFEKFITSVPGLNASSAKSEDNYMYMNIQVGASLSDTLGNVLTALEKVDPKWNNADFVERANWKNKVCIGLEGKSSCPKDL